MAKIKIKDLPKDQKISKEEMKKVKGGMLDLSGNGTGYYPPYRPPYSPPASPGGYRPPSYTRRGTSSGSSKGGGPGEPDIANSDGSQSDPTA